MEIIEAPKTLKNKINNFYKQQGYHSGWGATERAFFTLQNDEITGVVKVEKINEVSILRGMYLADAIQRQGQGTKFIQHIEAVLNETVSYCMPFKHLKGFYSQIGFKQIPVKQLPWFLQTRFSAYEKAGYVIIAMQRDILAND